MELSGVGKFGLIIVVLIIGLDLQGRWTGESMSWDLLGQNPLGTSIRTAQYTPPAGALSGDQAAQLAAYRAGAGTGGATPPPPPGTAPGWQPAPTAQVA